MSSSTVSYTIETEISSNYIEELLDFIYQKYVLREKKQLANISRATRDGSPSLSFGICDSMGKQILNVEIKVGKPVSVKITKLDEKVPEERVNEVKEDIDRSQNSKEHHAEFLHCI